MAFLECKPRFGTVGTSSAPSHMPGTCTSSMPTSGTPKPSSGARSSASSPEPPSTNKPPAPSAAVEGARGVRSIPLYRRTQMDPAAAWRELTDALASGNHDTAKERAEALIDWIGNGGFNPINCSHSGAVTLLGFLAYALE